jgi:hypothetical protein
MPYTQQQHDTRQLNRWARYLGYADFETYLATGGTVTEALSVLRNLRDSLEMAMRSIVVGTIGEVPPGQPRALEPEIRDILPEVRSEAAAAAANETTDKPGADNAHPQGEELHDAGAGH